MSLQSGRRVAMFLPSLAGGGAERVILNLAIGLADRGFPTDLVLARAEGPYLTLVPSNVRVVDLAAPRVLRSLRPLATYLRRERPAALVAALDHANIVAMAASRLARTDTRIAITIHCTFPQQSDSLRVRTIPWLLGRLHGWADVIIAVSEGVADDVARVTRIPRGRVDVIYNPVITPDMCAAASEPPPHPWFEETSRPIVLGVGRLTAQKNFRLLIDAFAIVRRRHDARLVILGEGPQRQQLEAHVSAQGLEDVVALPGFVRNPYACIARASVLTLSSDWEGLPTVLIESLALDTPVVSTNCESGPDEILQGGAFGELVPVGDAAALAAAIERTLSGGRGRGSKAPRHDALQPYTLDAALDRFESVLHLHA